MIWHDQKYGGQEDHSVVPLFSYPFARDGSDEVELVLEYTPHDTVEIQCIVKKPRDMHLFLRELTKRSQRIVNRLEQEVQQLAHVLEWRDAGHGDRVRCIDALHCTSKEVNAVLRLCIWKGEPLIVKNCRGVMDWRPQVCQPLRLLVFYCMHIQLRQCLDALLIDGTATSYLRNEDIHEWTIHLRTICPKKRTELGQTMFVWCNVLQTPRWSIGDSVSSLISTRKVHRSCSF